ncbi:MAG: glycosyltransferase family 4 protein [Gammaproteobacteria bacterium]|nr:glycosyltransferase family 4 protein [Gammaproteobacteria bacterium]
MAAVAPLEVLTYSSLYPNARQPRHGIFIQQRLRHLVADFPVRPRVVAPVPWFPFTGERFGEYGVFAAVPGAEELEGVPVRHPRYPVIPKVSWHVSPWLMYRATVDAVRRWHAERPIDVLDAHFFYPDGVAAVMIGRALGIPVCISARGSDITLMPEYALPRRWILWAAAAAQGLVTVAAALKERLVELGVADERVVVLRNGVDLQRFEPLPRAPLRAELGLEGRVLVSVGNLIELKGHHLIIEALRELPDTTLLIIGDGPDRRALEQQATALGVAERVRFLGLVAQADLKRWYSAADALVLASSREGWANVLLEAMACGTPVAATRVWGTPEVVAAPAAGVLIEERSARGIVAALERLLAAPPTREATRAYAEGFSWEATSRGQYELFQRMRTAR